ncbi:hypothetical protein [Streptomyces xanthophaeus]|uniref:hypothetical protein n=1 Tax=Streptomyces xanthophaeus TaxID=67385 RepID=UPI00264853CB|nr:hypothetical protein [Streptomyces xanthophaeus]WKD30520.1 hypothetical protein KO717_00015 [Streptomyces xanthophaeus]
MTTTTPRPPTGLSITGTGSYLPEQRLDLNTEAARHPDPDAERIRATGYHTIAAEHTLYPGDMALIAAQRALAAAETKPQDIDLIAVTAIHRHGHQRLWSPASWLQSRLGATHALPFTVSQGCNAQLLVLDLAAGLLTGSSRRNALIVATDRFAASGFDRFTADYGIVYGDGAAAAVLTADTPPPPRPPAGTS